MPAAGDDDTIRALGVYLPEGHCYLHEMVWLVATWGSQGRLPKALGFVRPGDTVDGLLDQPAEVVARFVLGELLAAHRLSAYALFYPSGRRALFPSEYWSSSRGPATMLDSVVDLSGFQIPEGDVSAVAFVRVDEVAAALGIRLVAPQEPELPSAPEMTEGASAKPGAMAPPQSPDPPPPTGDDPVTPHPRRNYASSDAKLVAIMRKVLTRKRQPLKDVTQAAGSVVKMAQGGGSEASRIKRLVARYRRTHPPG